MDLILSLSSILGCSPFDPLMQALNTVQIKWIFESYRRRNPEPDTEKITTHAESMSEWQDKLSPEEFRKKLYGNNYSTFKKTLDKLKR